MACTEKGIEKAFRLEKVNIKSISILLFIYFWDRERQSMNEGGAERERETQNRKQAPGSKLSAQSLMQRSNSGPEFMT